LSLVSGENDVCSEVGKGRGKKGERAGRGEESIHLLPHPLSLLLIFSLDQRPNQRESSIPHPVLKIGSHASTNDVKFFIQSIIKAINKALFKV